MNNQEKAKHYAERIAEINRQVETGTVNFEQARVTIDTYKWLASKLDPSTYGNTAVSEVGTDLSAMHLEAIKKLSKV